MFSVDTGTSSYLPGENSNLNTYLKPDTEFNQRWIKNLNEEVKPVKLLEDIEEYLSNFGVSKNFRKDTENINYKRKNG